MKKSPRPAPPRARGPIVVTGGAGFIGSHVVEALLARGHEVRVLDDLSSGRAAHLPQHDPNLELRTGDILDAGTVASALKGASACIHLAAQLAPARSGADPYEATLGNILGFINVLEAARQRRVMRLVYASSAAVYGDGAACSERTPPQPTSPEGMEKLVAEGYAALYARRHGLRTLGLRYFKVYGPREPRAQRPTAITRLLERLEARRPALLRGDGRQALDYVHVEDAAAATVAALASDCTGLCNVASGTPTEMRELVRLLGHALDQRPLMHFAPAAPDEPRGCWGDNRRLREVIGFTPSRSLRTGLAELARDRLGRRRLRAPGPFPLHGLSPRLGRGAAS